MRLHLQSPFFTVSRLFIRREDKLAFRDALKKRHELFNARRMAVVITKTYAYR